MMSLNRCLWTTRRLSFMKWNLSRLATSSRGLVQSYSSQVNIEDTKSIHSRLAAPPTKQKNQETFASMLRKSSFIQVGEHKDLKLIGKIIQVQDDNIYVDFGGKFHSVCSLQHIPSRKQQDYVRGAKVVIMLQKFEATARFLGSNKDTTLLEAEARLVGLYEANKSKEKRETLITDDKLVYRGDEVDGAEDKPESSTDKPV